MLPLMKRMRRRSPSVQRKRRAGDAAIIGPAGELDSGCDFELMVYRRDRPFPQNAAVRSGRNRTHIEIPDDLVRVKAIGRVVDLAHHPVAELVMARHGLQWLEAVCATGRAGCREAPLRQPPQPCAGIRVG